MKINLFLIRHGRQCSKLCNVDVDLDEAGYRQAALVGERLAPVNIDAVYSSHYLRAFQTAQAANLYWNAEHMVEPELREISFGEMEGLSDNVIAERFCDFKRDLEKMETDLAYPGGECAKDVYDRVLPVMEKIISGGHQNIAVVTHGGVIRTFVTGLLGLDMAKWRILGNGLENGSITHVTYDPEVKRYALERLNDFAHLEKYPELLRAAWVDAEN